MNAHESQGDLPRSDSGAGPTTSEVWLALVVPDDVRIFESFVVETQENSEKLEASLLALERAPSDPRLYQEIFRPVHNIKGTGGFIGLTDLSRVCHEAESLLDLARQGRIVLTSRHVEWFFSLLDLVRRVAANLARAVDARLGRPVPPESFSAVDVGPLERTFRDEVGRLVGAAPSAPAGAPASPAGPPPSPAAPPAAAGGEDDVLIHRFLKVDAEKLDGLLDMVGELVIAYSSVHQHPNVRRDRGLAKLTDEVTRIVSRLQDLVMSLRLVAVKSVFARLERLVRDTARVAGKDVELVVVGEETEVDKTILEQLQDPLVHLLRNAVDHGIEAPAERTRQGKPPGGRVRLEARHEAGFLVVEIEDDGRGVDLDRVRAKAAKLGLDGGLDERGLLSLIFRPGFSTAERASSLSGRGVGLDVVSERVRFLGGRVDVAPRGRMGGAIFTLRLPLTTAIIDGLVVAVGEERYILPTSSVVETIQASAGSVTTVAGGNGMVSVHDVNVPLVRLSELFELTPDAGGVERGAIVLVREDTRQCCFLVDRVLGRQQVVVKALKGVKRMLGIAGGAILGDGCVALIVDVAGLIEIGGRWRPLVAAAAGQQDWRPST